MHPFSSHPPNPYRPYWGTLQNDPMIGTSQNNVRSGWESTSFRGCNQNEVNYYPPIPPYGISYNNGGGRHLPHQTFGPTNPVIAPSQQPNCLPHQNFGSSSPVVAPSQQPNYLPHQTSGPISPVVAPSQQPKHLPYQTSRPIGLVVAPSQQPNYLPHQNSGPIGTVVAPSQQPSYLPHQTSGPTNPIIVPSQQPKHLPHQTFGPTNHVVGPSQQSNYLPHQNSGPIGPAVAPSQQPSYLPHQTSGPISPVVVPSQHPYYMPHQNSGPIGPVVVESQQPNYLPHQNFEPMRPVVAASQQPNYLPHQNFEPMSPVVASSEHPIYLPHQTAGPISPVVAPSQKPNYLPHQYSRPIDPEVAPSQQPNYLPHQNSEPSSLVEAPSQQPNYMPHQTSGPISHVVTPSQQPKDLQHQTSGPTSLVVAPSQQLKYLPHQTSGPTNLAVVPSQQPPSVTLCTICEVDVGGGPKAMLTHNKGRKHKRMLNLLEESQRHKEISQEIQNSTRETHDQNGTSQNKTRSGVENISYRACSQRQFNNHDVIPYKGCGFNNSGGRYLASETSGPTIPVVAPSRRPPKAFCKICQVKLGCPKNMLTYMSGTKHKRMLKLLKKSHKQKSMNRQESGLMPNSQRTSTGQHKTIQKSETTGCLAEKLNSEDQAKKAEGESRDDSVAQGHGFKRKIRGSSRGKYMKTNEGIRRLVKSSKPDFVAHSNYVESLVSVPEVATPPGTPFEGSSLQSKFLDALDSQSQIQVSNGMAYHKIQNSTAETNDQPQSITVESHTPEGSSTNTQTKDVSSDSSTGASSPPQGPMASKVSVPPASVGSGFKSRIQHFLHTESDPQFSEAMEHYESHSPTDEANVQLPSSVLVKFQDSAGDSTDTETTDGSSKAEQKMHVLAPELEPQIQHVLHTDLVEPQSLEVVTHNESQCPTDEGHVSVLVDFQAPAGDSTHTETADGRSKDEQMIDVLAPELEPQSSEAVTHDESQCPTHEANVPQPSSVLVEFQAPAGDSTDIETADGSSKAEQIIRSDVLAPELEPQSSEAMTHNESQCPTDRANVQLPPSVLMEFQAHGGETADGSSEAKQKMDVLASDLEITQLPQVTICLSCGDEGFPEALVFCNKCQVYALHRYCMDGDGPVIPIDDIIWFCDDCNEEVADTPHYQSICLPSGTSDSLHLAENTMQARTEITNCVQQVKEHMPLQQNITESDGHLDAQPIVDPIWRGRIYLHNESTDIVNGVLAHLSSLACPRVVEETRLFPEMLCVEMLPRSQVWPKSFMKCGPSDDNIALYFFPENERDAFDKLVDEVISLDLAMRAVIENAELLFFPSTILPIKYQRFQAKYYLWGVFRAIQTPLKTNDAVCDKHLTRTKIEGLLE